MRSPCRSDYQIGGSCSQLERRTGRNPGGNASRTRLGTPRHLGLCCRAVPTPDPASIATLLVSCPDRRGIVAALAQVLYGHGANILDADQHTDPVAGQFFQRIRFDSARAPHRPHARSSAAIGEVARALRHDLAAPLRPPRRKRVAIFVSKYDHCLYDLLLRHRARRAGLRDRADRVATTPTSRRSPRTSASPSTSSRSRATNKREQEQRELELLDELGDRSGRARALHADPLAATFVARYPGRIINIHHSFLPAFVGGKPYHQAHERGVKLIGATAHYATSDLDEGPIIEQDVVRAARTATRSTTWCARAATSRRSCSRARCAGTSRTASSSTATRRSCSTDAANERSERAASRRRAKIPMARARGGNRTRLFLSACSRDLPPNVAADLRRHAARRRARRLRRAAATPTFDRLAQEGALFEQRLRTRARDGHQPRDALHRSGAAAARRAAQRRVAARRGERARRGLPRATAGARAPSSRASCSIRASAGARASTTTTPSFPSAARRWARSHAYPGAFWGAERFDGLRPPCDRHDRRRTALDRGDAEPFFAVRALLRSARALRAAAASSRSAPATATVPLEGRSAKGLGPDKLETLIRRYLGEVLYTDDSLAALLDVVDAARRAAYAGRRDGGSRRRTRPAPLDGARAASLRGAAARAAAAALARRRFRRDTASRRPWRWPTSHRRSSRWPACRRPPDDGRPLARRRGARRRGAARRARSSRCAGSSASRRASAHGVKLSVRDGPWKYIWNGDAPHELYDLPADPDERHNVIAREAGDRAPQLRAKIEERVAALPHDCTTPRRSRRRTREALRALGYVE